MLPFGVVCPTNNTLSSEGRGMRLDFYMHKQINFAVPQAKQTKRHF